MTSALRTERIGNATLYLGDCRDILPTLGGVDAVVTDPPYSEHVHSKSRRGGADGLDRDGYMASYSRARELGFGALDEETRRLCATQFARLSRRWVLVFSDLESAHRWREGLEGAGLDYCRTGLWHKQNATPQFTGDRPAVAAEAITIAHPRGRKTWNGGGRHAFWSFPIVINRAWDEPRLHTTQKPEALMAALLCDFTVCGETILDPFMGSGTTGVACIRLGRSFVGIETDPTYFETACRRIEDAYKQADLFVTQPEPQPVQTNLLDALG
jgi:DNA modification methylase